MNAHTTIRKRMLIEQNIANLNTDIYEIPLWKLPM